MPVGHFNIIGWRSVLSSLFSSPLSAQIPRLTLDTSNESFFRPDDKVLVDYNRFRNQFGKDEFIVVAVQGAQVFNLNFLNKLRDLHQDIVNNVPFLDKVTSLINVRNTRGEKDELVVDDFLAKWPGNASDLAKLRQRAAENTLYRNYILDAGDTTTAIVIKPLACNPDAKALLQEEGTCQPMTNVQNRAMVKALDAVVQRHNTKGFAISVSGMPEVIEYLNMTLEKDLGIIIPLTFVMIIIFLALLFRRISGVVYPILIFTISLLSATGLMAALGMPMTNITTILPSFMLVVSISDAVHILALFYPAYQQSKDRKQAIVATMEQAGLPVLMTSLTTAAGLASFIVAKVAPIADLGIVTPIGVFLSLLYTVLLIPALLAIFPVRHKAASSSGQDFFTPIFRWIATVTCEKQWIVISIFSVALLVAICGASRLRFEHNALKWFPKNSKIRKATEHIDRVMRGSVSFDVIIDTGKPDGLYDPGFIHSLDAAVQKLGSYTNDNLFVGKVLSLTTLLKETNRALHANNSNFYTLPDNKKLIAQELFLFQLSGSDDLDELVDRQFSKARITMHVPYRDTSRYKKFITVVRSDLSKQFPQCHIVVTGVNAIFVKILNNVMETMTRSYTLALLLVSGFMILMLGKLRMGLLSMIPNIVPLIFVMGLMGWLKIPVDLGTVLIGSITLGLVVDDTIHFLHYFGGSYDTYRDPKKATEKTLATVGRAMLVTSLVLAGGFLCNMASALSLNKHSGLLIAATILFALISDYFLSPAILSLVYTKKASPISATNLLTTRRLP